jgi:hypothetical protein
VDPGRLALARHNAAIYGVEARIRFRVGRAETVLAEEDLDLHLRSRADEWLCFVDPPWGMDWNRLRVGIDDLPVLRAILAAPRPETWVKVPPSFDPSTVPDADPEAWFGESEGDRHRVKFVLLRLPASRAPTG